MTHVFVDNLLSIAVGLENFKGVLTDGLMLWSQIDNLLSIDVIFCSHKKNCGGA